MFVVLFYNFYCFSGNKTCSDIKLCDPKAPSGSYVIDPDGKGGVTPFTVLCDMTDKNKVGVTVISHDSEDKTLVNGFSTQGSYLRNVTYTEADQLQLGRLTASSASCEQFIKYECHHTVLLYNGNMYGWWVSRDGRKMTYWGGVDLVPYKCACGLNNPCADASYGCNCDKNDHVWREDSGLLTNKSDLPVMQLRFGDTSGSDEKGYHTLGRLKCYGII